MFLILGLLIVALVIIVMLLPSLNIKNTTDFVLWIGFVLLAGGTFIFGSIVLVEAQATMNDQSKLIKVQRYELCRYKGGHMIDQNTCITGKVVK